MTTDIKSIAVIGLGSMGYGMAMSILRANHMTYGFDINERQVSKFCSEGGTEGQLAEIAPNLDAVVVVVLNALQTESVLFGDDGVVPKLKSGAVVIGCVTMSPDKSRDFAKRCEEHQVYYLDAPISGGSIRASNGELSIIASGSAATFAAARPVLDATATSVFNMGDEPGTGSAMKSVNQMLCGIHISAMAEGLTFAMTQGIEPKRFVEVLSKCAGTSWMLEDRAPHIVDADYSPYSAVDIWLKDLGIVMEIAGSTKFSAPLTAAALQQFMAASGSGWGKEDDAAVAKIYARNAGLKLPE